jgi:DNA polymerase III epsilon subunit-like protein
MNFYIDFEATQPEQEIISIGAVAENGETFYALIKPQFSSISQYVSQLTGITQEMINEANLFDDIMTKFFVWCVNQAGDNYIDWKFYSYGDSDIDFLKATLSNVRSSASLCVTSLMIATMKDYSKEAAKYFQSTTSLIKAFNYLKALENQQRHNALEDALMLAEVFRKIDGEQPLAESPFIKVETQNNYIFPTGKFYCKSTGKNAKEKEFVNIHDAMEWIIEHKIGQKERPNVRRDKMATKIMKAIRKKETYMQYKWRREKD